MTSVFIMDLLAYVRVSTEEQKKAGTHKTQMEQISRWAGYNNHTIIGWYQDLAVSGKEVKNRPEFNDLMNDIKTKGDGVVAFRLSRFGRSVLHLVTFVHQITEDYKKSFFCVQDNIDTTTAQGKLLLHVLSALAEFNREIIRENTDLGRKRAIAEGKRIGGRIPKDISQKFVEDELSKGQSPERIGALWALKNGKTVSGSTIRRRMHDWGIYGDYQQGKFYSKRQIS